MFRLSIVDSWHLAALNEKQNMSFIGVREIHFNHVKE